MSETQIAWSTLAFFALAAFNGTAGFAMYFAFSKRATGEEALPGGSGFGFILLIISSLISAYLVYAHGIMLKRNDLVFLTIFSGPLPTVAGLFAGWNYIHPNIQQRKPTV